MEVVAAVDPIRLLFFLLLPFFFYAKLCGLNCNWDWGHFGAMKHTGGDLSKHAHLATGI